MYYLNTAVGAVTKPFVGDPKSEKNSNLPPSDDEAFKDDELPEMNEEQLRSKEGALSYMLRAARNKYIERDLVGKVNIQMLYGVVLSGEFCTVNKHDKPTDLSEADVSQLSTLNFKALSSMDVILANLSRRSKAREAQDHMSDTTLTQGITFGFSFPLILHFGFTVAIQFEVTVASMVAYRKKKERLRLIKSKLKSIPNANAFIEEVKVSGGFSHELAQKAVIATQGSSAEDALRWAIAHDDGFCVKKEELDRYLESIPGGSKMARDVSESGGFSLLLAQKAVVATHGIDVDDAIRWAIAHDKNLASKSNHESQRHANSGKK